MIILLSGDIHLNTGPDYPCGKCGLNVHDDDKALCCDKCDKWIHVSCDQYISETIYDELVQQPSSDPWFCADCVVSSITPNCTQHHSRYLRRICLNARSLFPKQFALLAFLSVVNVDVIAITKTFLDYIILSSQLLASDYTIFHKDRNRHGGGVMVLVRSTIAAVRMLDLETNCEILWLKLLTAPSSFLFGVFYRSPGSPVDILEYLNCSRASIQGSSTPLVLCGDFNVPSID